MTTSLAEKPRLVDTGPEHAALGLAHRVLLPAGAGPHPTVVMLHGLSGDDRVMWIFAPRLPAGWLLVAPRAPHPEPRGGHAWLPRAPHEWPAMDRFAPAAARIERLIEALPATYGADPEAIYLMGFSQGAAAAFATTLRRPDLVRGVAGLVGFMPSSCEALADGRPLAGKPAFLAAGRRDPLVPLGQARAAAEVLRAAGADLTYAEYETGHKIGVRGMNDLGAWWSARRAELGR